MPVLECKQRNGNVDNNQNAKSKGGTYHEVE